MLKMVGYEMAPFCLNESDQKCLVWCSRNIITRKLPQDLFWYFVLNNKKFKPFLEKNQTKKRVLNKKKNLNPEWKKGLGKLASFKKKTDFHKTIFLFDQNKNIFDC